MSAPLPLVELDLLSDPTERGAAERRALSHAARDVGAFRLRAPSLSSARIAEALAAADAFFGLGAEAKARVAQQAASPTGYSSLIESDGSFESFFCVPPRASALGLHNRWPAEAPELERVLLGYMAELDEIGRRLMRCMAQDLGFPSELSAHAFGADSGGSLRSLRYPAGNGADSPDEYKPPHTDWCALALQVVSEPGLEVDAAGTWLPVGFEPGVLIVLVGSLMPFWSGGRYVACRHRVVATNTVPRTSLCFFFQPALDTVIQSIGPDGPLDAGEAKTLGALMATWHETRQIPEVPQHTR